MHRISRKVLSTPSAHPRIFGEKRKYPPEKNVQTDQSGSQICMQAQLGALPWAAREKRVPGAGLSWAAGAVQMWARPVLSRSARQAHMSHAQRIKTGHHYIGHWEMNP